MDGVAIRAHVEGIARAKVEGLVGVGEVFAQIEMDAPNARPLGVSLGQEGNGGGFGEHSGVGK